MKVAITYEKPWFSAHIKELHISTQGKNREELLKNLQEAIALYYEEEKQNIIRI